MKKKDQALDEKRPHDSSFFFEETPSNNLAASIMEQIREKSEEDANNPKFTLQASLSDILKIKRRILMKAITQEKMEELPADKLIKAMADLTALINTLDATERKSPTEKDEVSSKINDTERKRIKDTVDRVLSRDIKQ